MSGGERSGAPPPQPAGRGRSPLHQGRDRRRHPPGGPLPAGVRHRHPPPASCCCTSPRPSPSGNGATSGSGASRASSVPGLRGNASGALRRSLRRPGRRWSASSARGSRSPASPRCTASTTASSGGWPGRRRRRSSDRSWLRRGAAMQMGADLPTHPLTGCGVPMPDGKVSDHGRSEA